jgi:hypothetical protein
MLASGDGMLLGGWAAARRTTLFVDGVGDDVVTGRRGLSSRIWRRLSCASVEPAAPQISATRPSV